ncbi:c-type cytochrome [Kordiimonas lipolytica]|uniref:C-type cytochrome n=1 Tax=Kordiimonas lipolytica TaxID=1662421 RepID=A0ABV8UEP9_9PROT|nr:cytochrome c family protein [Kordiimonas lipolytica]
MKLAKIINAGAGVWLGLAMAGGAYAGESCDVVAGEQAAKKCVACHALDTDENKVGPSLKGVYGRTIASYEGFRFSRALSKVEGEWTEEELDKFLLKPQAYARGTSMGFGGLRKEQERADVICYLKNISE